MLHRLRALLFNPVATALSLIILLVVVVRIPSYAEPYWYGDEGIYLTIGSAMNHGAIVYKQIVDHKTPLIYYFARVGSQLNFRLLLTLGLVATASTFFGILLKITRRIWLSASVTAVFVLLASIPFLEGNIPNGELFVMSFAVPGLWMFLQTKTGARLLLEHAKTQSPIIPRKNEVLIWLVSGICLGCAILTKVPALFDAAALFFIGWLAMWDRQLSAGWQVQGKQWLDIAKGWSVLLVGVLLPIAGSIFYFTIVGAGKEYLDFGLLYNFHYVQNWSLGYLPGWGQAFFTLPVKAIVLLLVLIKLTLLGKWIDRPIRWAAGWFFLTLFASILSNRPYPHYMLQAIPPLILTFGLVFHSLSDRPQKQLSSFSRLVTLGVALSCVFILWLVWTTLRISHYPVVTYYKTYFQYATGQIDTTAYRNYFNPYLTDNYAASQLLKTTEEQQIFIWGTNPMLYALSGKQPVGRFTVAFHIHDLQLYQETIEAVQKVAPHFIVVMKDEPKALPGLDSLLAEQYFPIRNFEHYTVWVKRAARTSSRK